MTTKTQQIEEALKKEAAEKFKDNLFIIDYVQSNRDMRIAKAFAEWHIQHKFKESRLNQLTRKTMTTEELFTLWNENK